MSGIVHNTSNGSIRPGTKTPTTPIDVKSDRHDQYYHIDFNRAPSSIGLTTYHDDPIIPYFPEPGDMLTNLLYDDLIRLIYDTIDTNIWATATFRTYYDMVTAQRYLINHFRKYRNRQVTTRTDAKANQLYIRIAE